VVLFANAVAYEDLTELDHPVSGPMLRGIAKGHSESQP